MFNVYPLYGLGIAINCLLPGLIYSSNPERVDLRIWLGLMPPCLDDMLPTAEEWLICDKLSRIGEPVIRVWKLSAGDYLRFCYADGTEFVMDRLGSEVWATWPENMSLEDTATYLLGPIMGIALLLRGTTALHASAVVIDNQAIALVGPAGAGKSTTAAAFIQLGYRVLAEDVVALTERAEGFGVQPGYSLIRLWPSSVKVLYGTDDALPLLTPNWNKRYLDLTANGDHFQTSSLPLRAIYLLAERSDDAAAPLVKPLSGSQGLMSLVANTYASRYMDKTMRAREFGFLSRLATHVPVRQVVPHADPAYLSRLCEVIINDVKGLPARL